MPDYFRLVPDLDSFLRGLGLPRSRGEGDDNTKPPYFDDSKPPYRSTPEDREKLKDIFMSQEAIEDLMNWEASP